MIDAAGFVTSRRATSLSPLGLRGCIAIAYLRGAEPFSLPVIDLDMYLEGRPAENVLVRN